MQVRIVLLPDKLLSDKSRNLSADISNRFQTYFTLDDSHIPHITLDVAEFEENLLLKVSRLLETIASQTESLVLEVDDVKANEANFIGVYFKGFSVKDLGQEVKTKLSKLVSDWKYPEREIRHLTITRLKSEANVLATLQLLKGLSKESYTFDKLAICEEGESGTCKSVVAEFSLKK